MPSFERPGRFLRRTWTEVQLLKGRVGKYLPADGSFSGGDTGLAAEDEPFVTYGASVLPNARQYIENGFGIPGHVALEGTRFWSQDRNEMYVNNDGAAGWSLPLKFRVYTSVGESPATGITF